MGWQHGRVTDRMVRNIKEVWGAGEYRTYTACARVFGVSSSTVKAIVTGEYDEAFTKESSHASAIAPPDGK